MNCTHTSKVHKYELIPKDMDALKCILFNMPICLFLVGLVLNEVTCKNDGYNELEDACLRPCKEHSKPLECHYTFKIELYHVLSLACFNCPVNNCDCYLPDCIAADGMSKSILVVNRKLPGPSIQVCKNDIIVVDVENEANPHTTSIHWHGILQHNNQFMDGVPMITQCPIQPFTIFRYRFPAPEAGSFFWHSHSGLQKVDGVFGSLIIRQENDQTKYKYDYDLPQHVIIVNDWYNVSTTEEFARIEFYRMYTHSQSILVNGRGRYRTIISPEGGSYETPLSEFQVQHGKSYRFRLIGSGVQCGIQVSIEGHRLQIIETDGRPVVPMMVDAVNVYSGERYDFILNATNAASNYWMKFRGLEDCDNRTVSTYQVAILRYTGAPNEDPLGMPSYDFTRANGFVLNPATTDNKTMVGTVTSLTSTMPDDVTVLCKPDIKITLRYDYRALNDTIYNKPIYAHNMSLDLFHNRHPLPLINYIFNEMPSSPLLSEFESVDQHMLCNPNSLKREGKNCTVDFCACTHLIKVPLKAVVQVLFIDDGVFPSMNGDHPIHLHGHSFRVIAIGRFPPETKVTLEAADEQVAKLENLATQDKIADKLNGAVYKDTLNVPNGGYAVIRFYTDNPGFWFLHCHNDVHMEVGMGLIFQAGNQKHFKKPPPHFPKCGNFLPNKRMHG